MPDASFLPWQELNGQIFVPRAPETWNSQTRTASQVAMNQTSQRQDIVNICPAYVNMLDRKWMNMIEIDSWIWTMTKNLYIGIAFWPIPANVSPRSKTGCSGTTSPGEARWGKHIEEPGNNVEQPRRNRGSFHVVSWVWARLLYPYRQPEIGFTSRQIQTRSHCRIMFWLYPSIHRKKNTEIGCIFRTPVIACTASQPFRLRLCRMYELTECHPWRPWRQCATWWMHVQLWTNPQICSKWWPSHCFIRKPRRHGAGGEGNSASF